MTDPTQNKATLGSATLVSTTADKQRENRARAGAKRRGLSLAKCRLRDPHAEHYGTYMLMSAKGDKIVAHGGGPRAPWGLSIEDVEAKIRAMDNVALEASLLARWFPMLDRQAQKVVFSLARTALWSTHAEGKSA